eukprot:TRINITY_DN1416_c0_g1_i2.p1 TRINITY_DN1416_c0_g1~~TRINITY_DN1416_c0_g1_i2.p1  ORF type:complete len:673 (+),score=89.12 TRINITY_DN1416_c0_g1_i2:113-2020(+)
MAMWCSAVLSWLMISAVALLVSAPSYSLGASFYITNNPTACNRIAARPNNASTPYCALSDALDAITDNPLLSLLSATFILQGDGRTPFGLARPIVLPPTRLILAVSIQGNCLHSTCLIKCTSDLITAISIPQSNTSLAFNLTNIGVSGCGTGIDAVMSAKGLASVHVEDVQFHDMGSASVAVSQAAAAAADATGILVMRDIDIVGGGGGGAGGYVDVEAFSVALTNVGIDGGGYVEAKAATAVALTNVNVGGGGYVDVEAVTLVSLTQVNISGGYVDVEANTVTLANVNLLGGEYVDVEAVIVSLKNILIANCIPSSHNSVLKVGTTQLTISDVSLQNNTLAGDSSDLSAAYFSLSGLATFDSTTFSGSNVDGLVINIPESSQANVLITNSDFVSNMGTGLSFTGSGSATALVGVSNFRGNRAGGLLIGGSTSPSLYVNATFGLCEFVENSGGPAIAIIGPHVVSLTFNKIGQNVATSMGGAAIYASGLQNLLVFYCLISQNTGSSIVYLDEVAQSKIDSCQMSSNGVYDAKQAVLVLSAEKNVTITKVVSSTIVFNNGMGSGILASGLSVLTADSSLIWGSLGYALQSINGSSISVSKFASVYQNGALSEKYVPPYKLTSIFCFIFASVIFFLS